MLSYPQTLQPTNLPTPQNLQKNSPGNPPPLASFQKLRSQSHASNLPSRSIPHNNQWKILDGCSGQDTQSQQLQN